MSAHGSFNMSTEQLTKQLEAAKAEEEVERWGIKASGARSLCCHSPIFKQGA